MNIGFTKMHGIGNDFVVIDNMNGRIKLSPEQVAFLCDRHKGIGGDGVILIEKSDEADCFMNYYNSDGSMAEMCGNGVRCTAKYLKDEILKSEKIFKIATRAGIKEIAFEEDGTYSVNMGKPIFSHKDFPEGGLELEELKLSFVSMGNPHAVAMVKNLKDFPLSNLGPKIENDIHFPNKINFHLVEQKSDHEYFMATWERGSGVTLACGTGACAVYAILQKEQNLKNELILHLPGGSLYMSQNENGEIIMRGPAGSVFSGIVQI